MDRVDISQVLLLISLAVVTCLVFLLRRSTSPSQTRQQGFKQREPATDELPDARVIAAQFGPGSILPQHPQEYYSRPPFDVLYPGPTGSDEDIEVDIIAVHGLGSDVDWSWVWKDGERHVNWLKDRDMLPSVAPKARIMVYNYDSTWHANAPKTRLRLCGEDLVGAIHRNREGNTERPIIFIGHSLGGNVIVQALLCADADPNFRYLPKVTVGFVSLGTPFRGTKLQALPSHIAWVMGPAGSHRDIIDDLPYDNHISRDRLHDFCSLRNRILFPVSCFFELHETDYGKRVGISGVTRGMMVEEASATIPGLSNIPLQTDHFKINKFSGPQDRSFLSVSYEIRKMYKDAKEAVRLRENPSRIITDRKDLLLQKPEATQCIRDLFVTDPFEDKNNLKRKKGGRADHTCEWILGTEELTLWLDGSFEGGTERTVHILWLWGNPGTGKSMMSVFLADELPAVLSKTKGKTLTYFFCDSSFEERRTATGILRGLILQLLQQHPALVCHILPKHNERGMKLFHSFDALWTIFLSMTADTTAGRIYCIIDALDECDRESQETLLKQLDEHHSELSNIRILITSRPYPEIKEHLDHFSNKDLASFDESKEDVKRFVDEKVAKLSKMKNYTQRVKEKLAETLRDRADGIFLWVGLACAELEKVDSKDAVSFLQQLPRGLKSLYGSLLETAISSCGSEKIRSILSFIAVSFRPLTLLELSTASGLHDDQSDEDRLQFMREEVASCRLMVVVQDDKVLLLHQSVKDFLAGSSAGHFMDEHEAHANLAYRCVDQLILDFQAGKKGQAADGFLSYAVQYWADHAHQAQSKFQVTDKQAQFFDIESPCREQWLKLFRSAYHYLPIADGLSIFHVAAQWGISTLVEHACQTKNTTYQSYARIDIDRHNSMGETALLQAVRMGYTDVMRTLLDHGACEINKDLVIAAAGNSKAVMELLLDRRGEQVVITEEVVKAAAGNCKAVMELLLDRRGEQVVITEEVVKAAARNGEAGKEVIELLLDRQGEQVVITEEVVKAAARNREAGKEVIELLLDRQGEQVVITEKVVKAAAGNRQNGKAVMELLLDRRGEQVVITEEVVKAAAGNWQDGKAVMELLLDRQGEQVVITEEVVKAAARNGEAGKEVIELLLDRRGEQVVITEEVVKAAAGNRQNGKAVMELLLRKGIDLMVADDTGWTPLHEASIEGNFDVVKMLLKHGATPNLTDKIGRTPLCLASICGHNDVVAALLSSSDPNWRDSHGYSPLSLAARRGHSQIVKLLLGYASIDLESRDCSGRTTLWWARRAGHSNIEECLREHARKIGIRLDEDNLPSVDDQTSRGQALRYCDVCGLDIPRQEAYYHCRFCYGEDFDVCWACFVGDARCLIESHELVQMKNGEVTM